MPHLSISRPAPTVWQITLDSPPDNRLVPSLLKELGTALDIVEAQWRSQGGGKVDPKDRDGFEGKGAGALVLTSALGKFFSNGLDLSVVAKTPYFFEEVYDPLAWRLLTFPLLTIGAINGHAFAGGMVLALCCDYRVITSGKGWFCMNEVVFGSAIPNAFHEILRYKIPNQANLRDTFLAHRWTQPELLKIGLVDEVVEPSEVVKRAVQMGVERGPIVAAGSYGAIKRGQYREVLESSRSHRHKVTSVEEDVAFWNRVGKDKARAKL
ncbi:hypothetical protein IAT38_007757 [Cryptococcus sp. DSM 104549]